MSRGSKLRSRGGGASSSFKPGLQQAKLGRGQGLWRTPLPETPPTKALAYWAEPLRVPFLQAPPIAGSAVKRAEPAKAFSSSCPTYGRLGSAGAGPEDAPPRPGGGGGGGAGAGSAVQRECASRRPRPRGAACPRALRGCCTADGPQPPRHPAPARTMKSVGPS